MRLGLSAEAGFFYLMRNYCHFYPTDSFPCIDDTNLLADLFIVRLGDIADEEGAVTICSFRFGCWQVSFC